MIEPAVPHSHSWDNQFLISRTAPKRTGWIDSIPVGEFFVYLYPDAEALTVNDAHGQPIGLFIGQVIDVDNQCVARQSLTFDVVGRADAHGSVGVDQAVEDFAYQFGGSWLLFLATGLNRLYMDCTGSRSVVFSPGQQAAAATTGLLLTDDEYRQDFRHDLYQDLDVEDRGWFPGGYTAHTDVQRLLPNHYLALDTWTTHRHWPLASIPPLDLSDASEIVADVTASTSRAIVAEGATLQGLTGGTETRFMLAANRTLVDDLDFVTLASPAAKRDMTLAARVVELTGINHRFIDLREADDAMQQTWLFKASHCITGHNMTNHPSLEPLERYRSLLGGLGGEVGRAFFWRPTDDASTTLTASTIAARFGMPQRQEVIDATEKWLTPLIGMDPLLILDLAYLELRLGPWAFAQKYTTNYVDHAYPMVHRRSYQALLGLAPEDKRSSAFIREGIRQSWPELLTIPINEYGNYRDRLDVLAKLAKPRLVATKLRKRLG